MAVLCLGIQQQATALVIAMCSWPRQHSLAAVSLMSCCAACSRLAQLATAKHMLLTRPRGACVSCDEWNGSALEPTATGQILLRLKVDGSSGCPVSLSLARKKGDVPVL
ncbi:hypothetical protein COO60DRAFT_419576 [Scenedesmus sp. NREL 46B-D3]|nr:hypothetical protein COO60DRAFT_419576 [Scenedesmus sp. NREL 46B-D3]